jgi:hypothetical protein
LYDLVVGQLDTSLGLNGVVWLTAVVIAAVFGWMFHLLLARGTGVVAALVVTLLAISASMIHFLARPHVVSWLLTLAWWWILSSYEHGGGRSVSGKSPLLAQKAREKWGTRLWILPVLMVVWVNVHGGFLVGFVLLGIFWVSAAWEWWSAREDRIEDVLQKISAAQQVRKLTWVGLASVAASFVNPYGWKLHAHVYSYLTNRFLMDHIEEFQSPNFHGVAQKCFAILVLITIVVMARKVPTSAAKGAAEMGHPPHLRLSEIFVVLFAVWSGLYAARNIPVSAVLLGMIAGPRLPDVAAGFSARMAAVQSGLRGHLWPLIAVMGTLAIAANGGRVGSSQMTDAHFDGARMPVGAVDFLKEQAVQGPIFSPDYWGGYLIYRLYPEKRVVVDDRHDLYGEEFLERYLKVWRVEEGWDWSMASWRYPYLLLPRNAALTNALVGDPQWKAIYRDETAVVFENESKANQ